MKYYLRSKSTSEHQKSATNGSNLENKQRRKKNKINKKNKKFRKSLQKKKRQNINQKVQAIAKKQKKCKTKETNTQSVQQARPLHLKILRFPSKYQRKTFRVYCYRQSDIGFPRRFSRKFIKHSKDDDKSSSSSLIEAQMQRVKETLFEEIRKRNQQKLINCQTEESNVQSLKKTKRLTKKNKPIHKNRKKGV